MKFATRRLIIRGIMIFLTLGTIALIASKIIVNEYSLEDIIPLDSYNVTSTISFTGNGNDVVVRTFLPRSIENQEIASETIIAEGLNFSRESTILHDRGDWAKRNANGDFLIKINYDAYIRPVQYIIPNDIPLSTKVPENLTKYLEDSEYIQVSNEDIQSLAGQLKGNKTQLKDVVSRIYDYIYTMDSKPFKGTTDAVTALKLGEASCNGKSRLFVALARSLGIPARLVGGLILNEGTKRTSHQWLELYINGHWVPFDALNNHFARMPDNYLRLYTGDEVLFKHSKNIGFNYHFDIQKNEINNTGLSGFLNQSKTGIFTNIAQHGFGIDVLQFLLVIPFGVMFVVLFKNVVGFKTYGTFLPALMAMAIQGMGIGPGIFAFVLVLVITILVRIPLEKLGLLHTPKLAILMLVVIASLIGISSLALFFEWEGFASFSSAAVFPIAILTITSERISLTIEENGIKESVWVLLQTLVVTSVCYFILSSVALKALVLVFPELLLGVLVLNLWIGSWTGIRLTELYRFRSLIFRSEK